MFTKFRPSQIRPNTFPSAQQLANEELERWLREDVLGLSQEPEHTETVPAPAPSDEKPGEVPHRDAA